MQVQKCMEMYAFGLVDWFFYLLQREEWNLRHLHSM
jgi:hypothetical protein